MIKEIQDKIQPRLVNFFRPIARFCLKNSIKVQPAIEALKESFIIEAKNTLSTSDTKANVSRVSIITGLHRRDVTRLIDENNIVRPKRDTFLGQSILVRVIGQWLNDERFLNEKKQPKVLSTEGNNSEFAELCSSISKDINSGTILFELQRIKAIEFNNKNAKLIINIYSPKDANVEESIDILTADVGDLIDAAAENIFDQSKIPNLHIKTEYDNIPVKYLDEIKKWAIEVGNKFHQEAREFLSKYDRDINKKVSSEEGRARVSIGTFSYQETVDNGEENNSE